MTDVLLYASNGESVGVGTSVGRIVGTAVGTAVGACVTAFAIKVGTRVGDGKTAVGAVVGVSDTVVSVGSAGGCVGVPVVSNSPNESWRLTVLLYV